jgi:predicted RND superfamily exporter protein
LIGGYCKHALRSRSKSAIFPPPMGFFHRRLLTAVLAVVTHPRITLLISLLAVAACVILSQIKLDISTDQNDLFSHKVGFFRDYLDFIDKFPENEAVYVIVRPTDPAKKPPVDRWTAAADAIANRLGQMPKYVQAVESRVPLDKLGAQGILFDSPDQVKQELADARRFVPLVKLWGEKPTLGERLIGATPMERFIAGLNIAPASVETMEFVGAIAKSWDQTIEQGESASDRPIEPDLKKLGATDPSRLGYFYVANNQDPSQHQLLVRVYKQPDFTSLTAITEEVDAIRDAAKDAAKAFPEFTVAITGRPALDADEMRTTDVDSHKAETVALIVVFFGLYFMLRSLWLALAAELALAVGIGWTFGWATISLGHLNLLSMVFLIALIGIGMDYLVQILMRYRREARRYTRPKAIWFRVFAHVSAPINTACMGAAGAFLVSTLTDFRGAAELGVIAGGGLLLCLLAGYTVLPALLTLFPAKVGSVDPSDRYPDPPPPQSVPRRLLGPVAWIVLVLLGIPYALRVAFDAGLIGLQAPNLESVQLVRTLQTWYGAELSKDLNVLSRVRDSLKGAPTVASTDSVLNALDNQAFLAKPENQLAAIEWATPEAVMPGQLGGLADKCLALAKHFQSLPDSGEVVDQLKTVGGLIAGTQNKPLLAARLTAWQIGFIEQLKGVIATFKGPRLDVAKLPAELRGHYQSADGTYALYIYPKQDLWQRANLQAFVEDVESRVKAVPDAPAANGIAIQVYHSTAGIRDSFKHATIYALVLIVILVFLDMRKISQTLMAISVLALGLPMLIAIMGLLGVNWNFANFFGLPILIGAGHEYGVFLVHRYKESLAHPRHIWRGWDVADRALLLCAFVTSSSFGFFWALGHHQGLRSLGLVMAIGTACIYLSAVCVLEPMLKWRIARKRAMRSGRED